MSTKRQKVRSETDQNKTQRILDVYMSDASPVCRADKPLHAAPTGHTRRSVGSTQQQLVEPSVTREDEPVLRAALPLSTFHSLLCIHLKLDTFRLVFKEDGLHSNNSRIGSGLIICKIPHTHFFCYKPVESSRDSDTFELPIDLNLPPLLEFVASKDGKAQRVVWFYLYKPGSSSKDSSKSTVNEALDVCIVNSVGIHEQHWLHLQSMVNVHGHQSLQEDQLPTTGLGFSLQIESADNFKKLISGLLDKRDTHQRVTFKAERAGLTLSTDSNIAYMQRIFIPTSDEYTYLDNSDTESGSTDHEAYEYTGLSAQVGEFATALHNLSRFNLHLLSIKFDQCSYLRLKYSQRPPTLEDELTLTVYLPAVAAEN